MTPTTASPPLPQRKRGFLRTARDQWQLYAMILPFAAMVLVFNYVPIWGWITAFQKYRPGKPLWEQRWVGFENFVNLFQDERFYMALRNTLAMSVLGLLIGFTVPIIFALLLNELRSTLFKRTVQTISYLPHFVSWVVVAGLVYKMLSPDSGPINQLITATGGQPVQFLAKPEYFWGIVVLSDLWKELGWNTIIYLSAITAIDSSLYDAAKVDGAGRFGLIRHVTLPGIMPVITVLLVLAIGNLMSIGFEKQLLLGNPIVYEKSMVLDLFALRTGIGANNFSFGTTIGMVNSLVGLMLLFTANWWVRRRTGESVI